MLCWTLTACGMVRSGRAHCPNWARALSMARDIASCDGNNRAKPDSQCVAALMRCQGGCDICQSLGGPRELKVVVADEDEWAPIKRVPISSRNPNGYDGIRCKPVGLFNREYKLNWQLCNDKDATDVLASTILHEAMHECVSVQWPGILDSRVTTPAGCSAEELENRCVGR
jgi:hypothetical protein